MIRLVEDVWETVDLQPCALRPCETNIGMGRNIQALEFVPFYEVTSPGEPAARFCEPCGDWLREALRLEVTA